MIICIIVSVYQLTLYILKNYQIDIQLFYNHNCDSQNPGYLNGYQNKQSV